MEGQIPDKIDLIGTDSELIHRSMSGDKSAFSELMKRHWKFFYIKALGFVHNSAEAEDIVQQGILLIYQNLTQLQDSEKFNAWSQTIIKNVSMDYFQKKKQEKQLLEKFSAGMPEEIRWQKQPEDVRDTLDAEKRQEIILETIGRLPDLYRKVMVLHYSESLTYPEIARRLHIPTGTVEVRLHRAKNKLKKLLKGKL